MTEERPASTIEETTSYNAEETSRFNEIDYSDEFVYIIDFCSS
jgi:hypothetical protein